MKLMSSGENGGGQRGKFGADGCCVRIAWEFSGDWMDTYRVVLFPSRLTVQIVSAICDCWVISLSRFCCWSCSALLSPFVMPDLRHYMAFQNCAQWFP